MLARDKILRETSPLSIFFVKSGSGGNRLLFRYPYDESFQYDPELSSYHDKPLMAQEQDRLQFKSVIGENDEALCNLFSVHPNLCGQKFEIKINSVRHVGHPMSLLPPQASSNTSTLTIKQASDYRRASNYHHHHHTHVNLDLASYDCLTAPNRGFLQKRNRGDITSFNIVCALRSSASYDIVDCYHDLSKRLAIALSFEERRCSYLSKEIKTILTTLEESDIAKMADRDQQEQQLQSLDRMSNVFDNDTSNTQSARGDSDPKQVNGHGPSSNDESVFSLILSRSNLARDLKRVFINLSTSGIVDLKMNNWVTLSFCLPQKVHRLKLLTHKSMPAIGTRDIKRCLTYLRPYHGLLLLQEPQELLDSLPIDASPAFIQLIRVIKPDKNFLELSVDANLTLLQIFSLVSQLIYWAKATVIYPICDSNIYAIHPSASTGLNSQLASSFKTRFPSSKSLHHYLADFSEGISLSQLNGPLLSIEEKMTLLSITTWLLQRRILTQIHKYIFLVVDSDPDVETRDANSSNTYDLTKSSSQGIEINVTNHGYHNNITAGERQGHQRGDHRSGNHQIIGRTNGNSFRDSSFNSTTHTQNQSSPQLLINKNSLNSDLSPDNSVLRRHRNDSLPESQDDPNFGLNSSFSSTPNSNMDFPSPSNTDAHIIRGSSLSSSCPLDDSMNEIGSNSVVSALQRVGLTQSGIKNVLAVPSSKNIDDLRLLLRLMPYFDGKHHVEDIMFFENLERSQVLILCDKFRDILYTCHYGDVAVSQLSPFDN